MKRITAFICTAALGTLSMSPAQAEPLLITWTGTLDIVLESGGGVFANSAEGDEFTGSFVYASTAGESSVNPVSPTETIYSFSGPPFAGTIENTSKGEGSFQEPVDLTVADNDPLDANDAQLINAFLMPSTEFMEDDPVDAWALEVDPGDPDPEWFIAFVDVFAPLDLYNDTGFRADPPALGSVDLAVFQLEQVDPDNEGEFLFLGAGLITGFEVTPVPVPAVALLFPSGLLAGLAWMRRRLRS